MLHFFLYFAFLMSQISSAFTESPTVVIVGAGAAGIAAAAKLLENSITNITILEAENRIGGRINTVKFGEGYVDLGAEYCHGEKGNAVFERVKDLNVLQHSNLYDPARIRIFDSGASAVPEDLALDLIDTISTYDDDVNTAGNASLGDAFLAKYKGAILEKYSKDKSKLTLATDGIKMLQDVIATHEGAFNWQGPAAGRHYDACPGDQTMTWKTRGYHMILDVLMRSYPDPTKKLPIDDKISLSHKVDKIIWKDNEVTVKVHDKPSLTADHVIFTPSIGVLRRFKDSLFEPRLPPVKLEAIEAMGFDGIVKIMLHFPGEWWTKEDSMFFFLWKKEDLGEIAREFPDGPSKDGVSWVSSICAMVKVPSNPNVLVAWFSGELAPDVENIPEDVVRRGCNYVIRKFLSETYNVTDADKVLRSQWVTNPNFLGTYSYEKVGYYQEDVHHQAKLAQPLVNKDGHMTVLFAGEATHSTVYSTVHGAVASGIREAERIINLYK